MERKLLGLGPLAFIGGCTWISTQDIDTRRVALDDDQDGYISSEDCDDGDASISPGAEEAWYDGVDADCLRDDDYDADRDGYVAEEHLGATTIGVETSGLLPGGDCDDARRASHPGAVDGWYDGVDSDCAGNDDYDIDGDGYVRDEFAGLPTEYVPSSGGLPGGDCDDGSATVYAGAPDAWYDGEDRDCAGDDDFDQDGDGYVRDEYVGLPTEYLSSSGGLPGGDCDDEEPSIHEAAQDTWYDGEDWDCAGDDDFDQDGDGYVPDGYVGMPTEGVKDSGGLPAGDCTDTDADINPGRLEVLSDPRDLDCDQGGASVGGASFRVASLEAYSGWQDPFAPKFAENASAVFLSLATRKVRSTLAGSGTDHYQAAVALSFDGLAPQDGPLDEYFWQRNPTKTSTFSLTAGHDFLVTNDYLFGVTGLLYASQRVLRLGGYDLVDGTNALNGYTYPTTATLAAFTDLSIAMDDEGTLYALGCDATDGIAQYIRASLDSAAASSTQVDAEENLSGLRATRCALSLEDAPDGTVYSTQAAGLVTDTFDLYDSTPVLSRQAALAAYTPVDIIAPDMGDSGLVVVVDPDAIYVFSGGSVLYTAAAGESPQAGQAALAPDGSLVIAYVDGAGDAHVLHGDPDAGMVTYDIQADFAAYEVAAWVESTGEHLLVAVVGESDVAFGAARL